MGVPGAYLSGEAGTSWVKEPVQAGFCKKRAELIVGQYDVVDSAIPSQNAMRSAIRYVKKGNPC